ncbi:helix-turn-helix domain-containing protein [Sphingobium sp. CECT 9361]|uniref:helix-turn-helix domain-containing protein n=1 Tax=Sphingobium sp. CECT 9361 TaxID=2845384 RepID=UPI001E54189A|nr:helix-turn-helix domain-containing protein [Sphingobium sp. CECT 9361]CAH0355505.1 hypothetical protein SPH9361_03584 [Sphingobium sp. CECT 9361]
MPPQSTATWNDAEIFALIKSLSGKRIEQRRRRDRISQARLAAAIGRSERWVRELEAGIPTSTIEDHVRCAHWLGLSTAHIFIPLLCVEHGIPLPAELLALDDIWHVEASCLQAVEREQARAVERSQIASGRHGDRKGTLSK